MTKLSELYKDYRVVFTGHSLGGALTLHAVADALLCGILKDHDVYVYTFGQPRVGNAAFLNLFTPYLKGYYRVVHYKDMVAHIPPCIPNLHSG